MPGQEHDDGAVGGKQMGQDSAASRGDKGKSKLVEDKEGTPFDLVIGCDGSWSKVR